MFNARRASILSINNILLSVRRFGPSIVVAAALNADVSLDVSVVVAAAAAAAAASMTTGIATILC